MQPLSAWIKARRICADYIALSKPRIVVLLLVTALGGMMLAAQSIPAISIMVLVLVGGGLAAGGAGALNQLMERDLDGRMKRTRHRPMPSKRIKPWQALVFGITLNVVSFGLLAIWVNLLSAALTITGTLYYVFVYTWWLKRSTHQNIVIGGAAGAIPPLAGWAAITGGLGLPAFYLFAIIFFWTPPHFWALSLLIHRDYAEVGVPMLPVVSGIRETTRSIMLYSLILVSLTILFYTTSAVGLLYLAGASILGIIFLVMAWRLLKDHSERRVRSLYLYSILYLGLLFVIIMVDAVVGI